MKNKLGITAMLLGVLCIGLSAGLLIHNTMEEKKAAAEADYIAQALLQLIATESAVPEGTILTNMPSLSTVDMDGLMFAATLIDIEGESYMGILDIPALGLSLPVNDSWSDTRLKASPCRFYGSLEEGGLVIAAHNYANHFGNIASLSKGDSLQLTDAGGNQHHYTVSEIDRVKPEDVRKVVLTEYALTLFTCDYSGSERIVVRCSSGD